MARPSIIYELINRGVNGPLRQGFYRKIEIQHYDTVPKDCPVIFAANHQNALLDALNVVGAVDYRRQTTFLTRSDVFNHSLKGFMIRRLKMLPIYRQRDGVDVIAKNEEIFQICVDRLSDDDAVLIFPEGNHSRFRRVRPLKKGLARIGFQAAEQNNFDLDLKIVPVGLNYHDHIKFHNDLLVSFGPAIPLSEYYADYQENPSRTLTQVMRRVREAMSKEVIHILDKEHYELIDGIWQMYAPQLAQQRGFRRRQLEPKFAAGKEIVEAVEKHLQTHPEEGTTMGQKLESYFAGLKALRMRDHIFWRGQFSLPMLLLHAVFFLLTAPLYLYGALHNYLPYRLSYWPGKFFQDDHFHSSIRSLAGYVIFPLCYILQTLVFWGVSGHGWWALAYLVSLPLTGIFAINYSEGIKKWWSRMRFGNMKRRKHPGVERLMKLRQELVAWCQEVMEQEKSEGGLDPSLMKTNS